MTCGHRLNDDPTGLCCVRDHVGTGHVYESSTASWSQAEGAVGGCDE